MKQFTGITLRAEAFWELTGHQSYTQVMCWIEKGCCSCQSAMALSIKINEKPCYATSFKIDLSRINRPINRAQAAVGRAARRLSANHGVQSAKTLVVLSFF